MKFSELVLKYRRIVVISLVAAISFLLLCLISFYLWLNYHTMAQVGDFKITRKVVLDNIGKNKDYVLTVKGKDANIEKEVYQMLLEQEAAKYESAKRGITVSDQELTDEILTLSTDDDTNSYYKTVSSSYGWSKEEANQQVSARMLKEKLENSVVGSYDVQGFLVRSNVEPKQGETIEQIKTKALELATQARLDASAGKSLREIKAAITAASPLTWSGDMTHGWTEVDGLNSSNEADKLANAKFWPEIQKLNKKGDVTNVIDATTEGGLYIFWQLDSKTSGTYDNMAEFYQSFQPKNPVKDFLLRMTPTAYAACNNWINNNVINIYDTEANGTKGYYRITYFEIKVRDASTHAVITTRPNAHIVTSNVEPATGHCDSSWCNMDQDDVLGTNGQATMYNSCCQFTYAVAVTGMDGFRYVHTHRAGVDLAPNDTYLTTAYRPHFNGVNGVNNMYGQMDYNPVTNIITSSTIEPLGCPITPTQIVSYGGEATFTSTIVAPFVSDGFLVDEVAVAGTSYTFSNVIEAHKIVAKCHRPTSTYKVTANTTPGGTAATSVAVVNAGGSATLTATPSSGFDFSHWTGDCIGAKCLSASFDETNIQADKDYTAYFKPTTPAGGSPKLSCTVTPATGESPLVVKVHTTILGGATGPFQYKMAVGDSSGDELVQNDKPADFWYTYSKPGTYMISVNLQNNPLAESTTCYAASTGKSQIVVTGPGNSSGGEVAQ